MERPSIVMVHGFWGGAAHWAGVIGALDERGFRAQEAVKLPLASLREDADIVRRRVGRTSGPVLLVGHSYGGAVITEAGDLDNVVGLVYIAAFAPDAGESPGALTEQCPPQAAAELHADQDGYLWVPQDRFHDSFCQDLPAAQARAMAVTQRAPRVSTFAEAVTRPAWRAKPSWYQLSLSDRMIHPENQARMASRM